ncbi:MAG: hypothetical protein ACW99G_03150 [Candidatus Thorarchaeota archaeon]|jgi:hypothetical protein
MSNKIQGKKSKRPKGRLDSDVIRKKRRYIDPTKVEVTQFGLQRSGTNLTRYLFQSNYDVVIYSDQYSWKHGFYQNESFDFSNETHVIVTIKNPFAWFVSMRRYSADLRELPMSDFLRSQWAFEGLANVNPIVHWNTMNDHWINLVMGNHEVVTIRYEDLLTDPEKELNFVSEKFSMKRQENINGKIGEFFIPDRKVGSNTTEGVELFDKDYYLEKKYMEEYTEKDINFIMNQLDEDMFYAFYPEEHSY